MVGLIPEQLKVGDRLTPYRRSCARTLLFSILRMRLVLGGLAIGLPILRERALARYASAERGYYGSSLFPRGVVVIAYLREAYVVLAYFQEAYIVIASLREA